MNESNLAGIKRNFHTELSLQEHIICSLGFLHQSTPPPTVNRLTLYELISCAYEKGEEGKSWVSKKSYKAQAAYLELGSNTANSLKKGKSQPCIVKLKLRYITPKEHYRSIEMAAFFITTR